MTDFVVGLMGLPCRSKVACQPPAVNMTVSSTHCQLNMVWCTTSTSWQSQLVQ